MRLKEDSTSWRSSAIMRRDFRHDFGTPEVHKGHPKRKIKKPRKRIDHKHVWVESKEPWYPGWLPRRLILEEEGRPHFSIAFKCAVPGCKAKKHKNNPRYGYEYHKWKKKKAR